MSTVPPYQVCRPTSCRSASITTGSSRRSCANTSKWTGSSCWRGRWAEANVEYSRHLAEKLEKDYRNLLGAETERVVVEDVYDYDAAFEQAFALINAELDRADDAAVWVNISAMPRTVSFAFATAAHSIMVEREEDRQRIHTYYTVPEKYLETELAEELRASSATSSTTSSMPSTTMTWLQRVDERHGAAEDLPRSSTSAGRPSAPKEVGGSHVVELPVALFSSVKPFEEVILFTLGEHGEFESVSELAHELASELGEEYTDSFRLEGHL